MQATEMALAIERGGSGIGLLHQPWLQTVIALTLLIVGAMAANWLAKKIVLRLIERGLASFRFTQGHPELNAIAARLSNIVPAVVIQAGIGAVPHIPLVLAALTRNVMAGFIILTIALAISSALTLVNQVYQLRPGAMNRPIKGYVQVVKIVVFAAAAVLIIAALMDRSPLLLLSGLGAMAAVLMLVFKDTLLSLVASVQISSSDIVRVGDWVEMPQLNADGDVIDIALHTVKVQNFDKTITTIPTHRLITESFKNWRGMSESGGRRIKRSLMIDQTSVRFLSADEAAKLSRFTLIASYLRDKQADITAWLAEHPDRQSDQVNGRRLTNVGTFRAYVMAYLQDRPDISKDMTLLVRQLPPSPQGLPLEIYGFTTTTAWAEYEAIQGDIFDHLLAILPEFGLRLFQQPSGSDLALLAAARETVEECTAAAG